MDYRVEQLAAACRLSVDTVRFYQSRGLLPPPRRAGRVALYGTEHVKRIKRIRTLQQQGLSLALIGRMLSGNLRRSDADLAAAVASEHVAAEEVLTLDQVAERSGVPSALLRAIEKAGLAIGRKIDGEERYTAADVAAVNQGLRLLEAGLPIPELLALGQRYSRSAREIAEFAVELFDTHIRTPLLESASDEDAAERVVTAFQDLLPAVTALVTHHFRSVLLQVAEEHLMRASAPGPRTRKEKQ